MCEELSIVSNGSGNTIDSSNKASASIHYFAAWFA